MLTRKNIMVDGNLWSKFHILSGLNNESISKLISKAMSEYIEKESKQNLYLRVKLLSEQNEREISDEEEMDILNSLAEMTKEDMEIIREEIID